MAVERAALRQVRHVVAVVSARVPAPARRHRAVVLVGEQRARAAHAEQARVHVVRALRQRHALVAGGAAIAAAAAAAAVGEVNAPEAVEDERLRQLVDVRQVVGHVVRRLHRPLGGASVAALQVSVREAAQRADAPRHVAARRARALHALVQSRVQLSREFLAQQQRVHGVGEVRARVRRAAVGALYYRPQRAADVVGVESEVLQRVVTASRGVLLAKTMYPRHVVVAVPLLAVVVPVVAVVVVSRSRRQLHKVRHIVPAAAVRDQQPGAGELGQPRHHLLLLLIRPHHVRRRLAAEPRTEDRQPEKQSRRTAGQTLHHPPHASHHLDGACSLLRVPHHLQRLRLQRRRRWAVDRLLCQRLVQPAHVDARRRQTARRHDEREGDVSARLRQRRRALLVHVRHQSLQQRRRRGSVQVADVIRRAADVIAAVERSSWRAQHAHVGHALDQPVQQARHAARLAASHFDVVENQQEALLVTRQPAVERRHFVRFKPQPEAGHQPVADRLAGRAAARVHVARRQVQPALRHVAGGDGQRRLAGADAAGDGQQAAGPHRVAHGVQVDVTAAERRRHRRQVVGQVVDVDLCKVNNVYRPTCIVQSKPMDYNRKFKCAGEGGGRGGGAGRGGGDGGWGEGAGGGGWGGGGGCSR